MATCLSGSLTVCQTKSHLVVVVIPNNLLFSAMVGLEIRPIAKLNRNRTEGLLTDGKEGWRAKKRFLAQRCNRRGESKRERTRECVQFYAPLIEL